jgi:hypothetical protein
MTYPILLNPDQPSVRRITDAILEQPTLDLAPIRPLWRRVLGYGAVVAVLLLWCAGCWRSGR